MRFFKFLAIAGAIALAATACKKEQGADNPTNAREDNLVNTSFVFNVATGRTPQTKQTSANTQATSSDGFRGIQEAHLLSFLRSGTLADGSHIAASATALTAATLSLRPLLPTNIIPSGPL